jgi:hypothetical protein
MPRRTASRFDDTEPATAPAAPGSAAALSVQPPEQAPLSAAAKAFNLQLKRIDKLKSQLQALDTLGRTHRQAWHDRVTPLEQRQFACMRDMALLLDERLSGKVLTARQRETASTLLCGMARTLAARGDADMAALHDRHSPKTLAQSESDNSAAMIQDLEAALGQPLEAPFEGASTEDILRAALERLRQAEMDEDEQRRAAAEKRKARKKPSAAQAQAQAHMEDATTTLRKLFRQLASALHPDREPDAQLRLAKTALMSEANAAYERQDLVALMQIQQRAALADPLAAARLSDDKLAALTQLLKQQVATLERERAERQDQLAMEFDVRIGASVTPSALNAALEDRVFDLETLLWAMSGDLVMVQTDAGLKRWLTQERKALNERMRIDPFVFF